MTQKSLDLLSFFNFLHLKPDFLADKKEKREKLKDSFRSDEWILKQRLRRFSSVFNSFCQVC